MTNNIVNHIKSTILGIVLISVLIYLLINNITHDYYILGGLGVSGILLFFARDKFINWLEKKVLGFEIKLPE